MGGIDDLIFYYRMRAKMHNRWAYERAFPDKGPSHLIFRPYFERVLLIVEELGDSIPPRLYIDAVFDVVAKRRRRDIRKSVPKPQLLPHFREDFYRWMTRHGLLAKYNVAPDTKAAWARDDEWAFEERNLAHWVSRMGSDEAVILKGYPHLFSPAFLRHKGVTVPSNHPGLLSEIGNGEACSV